MIGNTTNTPPYVARALLLGGALVLSVLAEAAPKSELWERWTAHDAASIRSVDHAPWTGLLERYVSAHPDGVHRFDYAGFSSADRTVLDAYLERLTAVPVSGLRRDEQLAYWINLYNALTVQVVLDHHPVDSILDIDISPGFFAFGPWDKKLVEVEGESLSLNDVEHRILRPIWNDPRVHYAVNCASMGCPNLQREAFSAANAEALLERAAREYVNHPRGVEFIGDDLVVSSIYYWFQDDFGGDGRGVVEHLLRYAEPPLADRLRGRGFLDGHDYDWSLNAP